MISSDPYLLGRFTRDHEQRRLREAEEEGLARTIGGSAPRHVWPHLSISLSLKPRHPARRPRLGAQLPDLHRAHEGRWAVIRIRVIGLVVAAAQTAPALACRNLARAFLLGLAALAASAAAAVPSNASYTTSTLAPAALTQARVIRAQVDARYRPLPGRRLAVTEATSTEGVHSLTLVSDWLELPRVVPADNGVYFAICSAHATCPYPARSAAWSAAALLPRREALELGLRTLLETSVSLVVVALPTTEPVWVVFERDDLLGTIDAPAVLDQLASNPAVSTPPLRELVGRLTRPRLFVPLPILPPPDDTIYAVRLFGP